MPKNILLCAYCTYVLGILIMPFAIIIDFVTSKKNNYTKKTKQHFLNPIKVELIDKKPCFTNAKIFEYMFMCNCFKHQFVIFITEIDDNHAHQEAMRRINNYLF